MTVYGGTGNTVQEAEDHTSRFRRKSILAKLEEERRIAVTRAPLARKEDHTHAVVWVNGVPFEEPLTVYPSETMLANVLLGLAVGDPYFREPR